MTRTPIPVHCLTRPLGASANINPIGRRPAWRVKASLLAVAFCSLLTACGGGGSNPESEGIQETEISGKAMAGPLAGGTVTAYELNADGSSGRSLGAASTDSGGAFRIVLSSAPVGAVRLVVSGGSYASLANTAITATGVALSVVVPSVGSTGIQDLAITPLTSFADRRLTALMRAATPLPAALAQAEAAIRLTYGIEGGSLPLYKLLPNFSLASGDAAILALLFGAFDQLAILEGRTPAEILRAIGEDWADGQLDGKTTGGVISYGNTVLAPATLATAGLLGAMTAYLAPANTTTIVARNGLTLSPTTVSAVQGSVVTQLQTSWAQAGNNSALLSGAVIGTGLTGVSELRKRIAVNVVGANTSLVFGAAYATRGTTTSDSAYVVLPVTNVGAEALCFVKLTNLTYRSAAGAALVSNGLTYVQGSVRTMTVSSISTDSCLAPGESGMVTDIYTAAGYTAVASMEFSVQATVGGSVAPTASVVPQAYSVQSPSAAYQSLAISLKNVGSGSAQLGLNHRWILFDDTMVPMHWGFASDTITPRTPLQSGATGSISESVLFYAGTGRKLLVFVDFDGATSGGPMAVDTCGAATSHESLDVCKLQTRIQRLSAQDSAPRRAQAAASAATSAQRASSSAGTD